LWKDRWYHRSKINGALTLFGMHARHASGI
jgi:hypothetical protein